MDAIKFNTNIRQILGGAVAGAGFNAASGMLGGSGLTDKAMKGAMAGAAITVLSPIGTNVLAMVWKPEAATAAKK